MRPGRKSWKLCWHDNLCLPS